MSVTMSTPSSPKQENPVQSPKIRIVGSRIYDSEHGKSCHQCRQKTRDFAAKCKNIKKRPCTITICHKCLRNRYGEMAEEVAALDDWKCPKCRGICNCSLCMKRKGHKPTGILVHAAKESGFSSVSELLTVKGPDVVAAEMELTRKTASPNKPSLSNKASAPRKRKNGKENANSSVEMSGGEIANSPVEVSGDNEKPKDKEVRRCPRKKLRLDGGNDTAGVKPLATSKRLKPRKDTQTPIGDDISEDSIMPEGNDLLSVAGIELSSEEVGPALQFLEFCSAFGEVLDLEKGQAESVIRELTRGRMGRGGVYSSSVQFHIKLLSLLQRSSEEEDNLWLEALEKCIHESPYAAKDLPLDCIYLDYSGYEKLDSSKKLRILNFLCDETLGVENLRNWIETENARFAERNKDAREKVKAAVRKEKDMKQKLKDEVAQAILSKNGAPLSISEQENLVSEIKFETEKAHAEMLEVMGMVPKKRQVPEAIRTEPLLTDGNGQVFWSLKGCSDGIQPHIMRQETGDRDSSTPQEKWYIYDGEQEKAVEKYISSLRKKDRKHKLIVQGNDEELEKLDSPEHVKLDSPEHVNLDSPEHVKLDSPEHVKLDSPIDSSLENATPIGINKVVYVDDIIITGSDEGGITELKAHLLSRFQTKDLGLLRYFLGIKVARSQGRMVLSQRKYVLDLLEETGMLGCKALDTLMESYLKLDSETGDLYEDPGQYRRLVGKLIYLTVTRPDISFAVGVVSQFMHSPRQPHWEAVCRILRYLKADPGRGLVYSASDHLSITGYSDARSS